MNRSGGLRALLVGLVVAVVVVVALPAPPASAHAALVETVPAAETAVDEAPDAIVLRFNEAVSTSLGGVKVFAAGGDDVDVSKPTTSGDGTTVTASLPALDDGAYAVSWRVVSADAHPIKGAFTFVVGDGAGGAAAKADLAERLSDSDGGATRMVGVAFGAARLAAFAGLVVLVGGIAFLWLLWPAGLGALGCRRLLGGAWLAAFTATIAGIALQGAYASAGTLADAFKPSLFADVLSTRFGTVWALRAGLLLLALAFVIPLGRERARAPSGPLRLGGALLGGALLLTPGLSGHASTGQWRIASLVSDVTHLGAVALWLGGLTVLAAVLLPRRDARTTTEVVPRFSRLAFAAVVIIVVTGTFQSWRQVRFADALTDTTFGRLLLVKVAVFVGLVGVAAFSRRLLHARLRIPSPARPRLAGPGAMLAEPEPDAEAAARLRRSVVVEVVLALAVLGVTAVLVQTVPGREAVAGGPFSTTVTGDGLLVEVTVDPAGVGANRLHVYSYDEDGLTAKPIPELTAEIAQPARDLGPLPVELELIYPGHWVSNGMQIPIRGTWELELTARLTEFDQIEVATAFEVDR